MASYSSNLGPGAAVSTIMKPVLNGIGRLLTAINYNEKTPNILLLKKL